MFNLGLAPRLAIAASLCGIVMLIALWALR